MLKRGILFVAVNILIIATITIILEVFGLRPIMNESGYDYQSLMIFCLVWGMVGSFISLALSRIMAKMMMGVKVIDPKTTASGHERFLIETVHRHAKAANIHTMPEVGIYNSPEVNAFATGPTKNRALVAVSTGLLQRMSAEEIEGVIGHEVAHIQNGDMVTMTLLQGVMNAFVMFFARIAAFAVSNMISKNNDSRNYFLEFGLIILFQIVFGILAQVVVSYFSRLREYRADRDGARLAGRPKMIAALERLSSTYELVEAPTDGKEAIACMKISGRLSGFMALLSTHPPLSTRIQRLKMMT
jgi:heat shock protein HtpX